MKVITNIIKFIVLTILTVCIVSVGIITIVSSTILDQSYIMQKLEETNFYSDTYELVKSNFENYIYQSGLDEEVLNDICTKEKVKQDLNLILTNIYQGTDKKIDTAEIADKLNANIDKLDIKNSKNSKAIEQFVTHICDEYTNTLIHTKYENDINEIYSKVTKLLDKLYNAIVIVMVVDIIILIIINIKKSRKIIQDLGIALLSTSVFNIIINNIVNSKVNIQGIKIFNDTFSNSIISIIQEVLEKILSFGIGALVISLILIAIYAGITAKTELQDKKEEKTTDK